jgi:hypothetical protein
MTATNSTSIPSSGSPLSAVDQVFAYLARLLSEMRNDSLSGLSSAGDQVLASDFIHLLSDTMDVYRSEL